MKQMIYKILDNLNLLKSGKVRDVYEYGNNLLIVASDRISAFDVIMDQQVQNKGKILNKISAFWFDQTCNIINNHLVSTNTGDYPQIFSEYSALLEGRSMLVKKCKPLPVEFVIRGYIAGSGWKSYLKDKEICGIKLPDGLSEYGLLPEPIFTPTTKAEEGHDENITFEQCCSIIGKELSVLLRKKAIEIYNYGAGFLYKKGIILADTKFEFGIDEHGEPILIDEALTPDSSRFWLKDSYVPGKPQVNFDKQVLRDYLESISWNKQPPLLPVLPDEIIERTKSKYLEAMFLITGSKEI